MFGNHPQGHNLIAAALRIYHTGKMIIKRFNYINIVNGMDILQSHGQAFQACAGIDILIFQFHQFAGRFSAKLGKYEVPYFQVTIAIATNIAIRTVATRFFTHIIIYFRAGTAGTKSDFPKVVLFTHTLDPVSRHSNFFIPYFKSFVVFIVNTDPETIFR